MIRDINLILKWNVILRDLSFTGRLRYLSVTFKLYKGDRTTQQVSNICVIIENVYYFVDDQFFPDREIACKSGSALCLNHIFINSYSEYKGFQTIVLELVAPLCRVPYKYALKHRIHLYKFSLNNS